jgi:AraC family transcriptional regulator
LLYASDEIVARLTSYPAGFAQHMHDHDGSLYSQILAGSLSESVQGRECQVRSGQFAIRTDGIRHSVRYGAAGALILGIGLSPSVLRSRYTARSWREAADGRRARQLLDSIFTGCADLICDRLYDLLLTDSEPCAPGERRPPKWLQRARERLIEEPHNTTVARLAHDAGVHRVHFSRAFEWHYGRAPSVFRRECMVSRSMTLVLTSGTHLAMAATEAGFADQSHLTRSMKQIVGITPGTLRNLFN